MNAAGRTTLRTMWVLAAVGTLLPLATPLQAQRRAAGERFTVASQVGIALPASRLADLEDPGANVGLHLAYRIMPRLALDVDGSVSFLNGSDLSAGRRAPDMRLWSYTVGMEADILPERVERWSLAADLGVGATTFDSDEFRPTGSTNDRTFSQTYFTTSGGLQLAFAATPRFSVFGGAQADWSATDRVDTETLVLIDPSRVRTFTSAWVFPLSVGLRARI